MIHDLSIACSGAVLFGYTIVALFFWRFWRQTRASLFAAFAMAFFTLAAERVLILTHFADPVRQPAVYLTRLAAFLMIIGGIWATNRARR